MSVSGCNIIRVRLRPGSAGLPARLLVTAQGTTTQPVSAVALARRVPGVLCNRTRHAVDIDQVVCYTDHSPGSELPDLAEASGESFVWLLRPVDVLVSVSRTGFLVPGYGQRLSGTLGGDHHLATTRPRTAKAAGTDGYRMDNGRRTNCFERA